MPVVVPTVTTEILSDYNDAVERLSQFASRLHLDISDGEFAPRKLLPAANLHWPGGMMIDVHAMLQKPADEIHTLMSLKPNLIVLHFEADDASGVLTQLTGSGIKRGIAILAETPAESIKPLLELVDHVLVFSGTLGFQGGTADLELLTKVQQLKTWKPELEIGWDGGISADNARQLVAGGVDVLNVGGYISKSQDQAAAFKRLTAII